MNKVILDPTHIRQQAIDDELLVDHSALAENAGFLTGVAVTKAVYHGVMSYCQMWCMGSGGVPV